MINFVNSNYGKNREFYTSKILGLQACRFVMWSSVLTCATTCLKTLEHVFSSLEGVTLTQLVKVCVGQTDVQRFEPHLGHNWLSCGVFLVKSRHFGLPLAQTIRPNWQSLSAGGSVAIQTWGIYKVYT